MAIVYTHSNKRTGEVFYVGASKKLIRPYDSVNRSNEWKEYVLLNDFEAQILKRDLSVEDAYSLEQILISWFGRKDLGNGNLVNKTDGGLGGWGNICSTERRIKVHKRHFGKRITEETRIKMSLATKNRKSSKGFKRTGLDKEKRGKDVIQLSKDKQMYLATYPSVIEAGRQTGVSYKTISAVCNRYKTHKSAGGYFWMFKNNEQ